MSIWYRAGTPTVSDGSTTVTFVGADLIANNVNAGDVFHGPDGDAYEIASITSATTLELTQPYRLKSGYAIQPTRGIVKDLRDAVQAQVSQVSGLITGPLAGRFPVGTAAAPGMSFGEDTDTGFYRASANAIGIALGGVSKGSISASGVNLSVPVTATGFTGNLTGNTTGTHTGAVVGNADTATALADPFTLTVGGGASGSVSLDGSGNVSLDLALESLPAVSATISDASSVVASAIYSLSDMSDGGAAIRNARHTSWYNAWGAFPETVGVYAEARKITIRDLTKAGAPVWLTLVGADNNGLRLSSVRAVLSLAFAPNGCLIVGTSDGLFIFDFVRDVSRWITSKSSYGGYWRGIATANSGVNQYIVNVASGLVTLPNDTLNAVASFVYPDAPCDQETGLPIATVAVGHSAGVSVIKADGSVQSVGPGCNCSFVWFDDEGTLYWTSGSDHNLRAKYPPFVNHDTDFAVPSYKTGVNPMLSQATSWVHAASWSAPMSGNKFAARAASQPVVAVVSDAGAVVSQLGTDFADTQFKNCVGSWLNSADDADLTGGELVTNGDFSNGLTGWTAYSGVSASGGSLTCSGAAGIVHQSMGLVSGKSYVLTLSYTETSSLRLRIEGYSAGGVLAASGDISGTGSGTLTFNFVAASSGIKIAADGASFTGTIDNVSVRLADPDRSVSGKGLAVYGTVQKSEAVAGSGGLMAYSGFSPTNYLQQPYNSALDFGAGDFTIAAMVYGADSLSTATIMSRATSSSTGWHLYKETTSSTGALKFRMASWTLSGTTKLGAAWHHVVVRRIGSTVSLFVNDRLEATYTQAADVSSTAPLQVGWSTVTPLNVGLPAIAQAQVYARGLSNDEISLLHRLQRAALHGKTTLRSGDIKSIASDPYSGDLHVLTAVGRQVFGGKTLQETEFEAITGKTKIAVHNGAVSLS